MELQSRKFTSVYLSHEDSIGRSGSPSKIRSTACIRSWRYRWLQNLKTLLIIFLVLVNVAISVWIIFAHGNLPEMFPGDHHTNAKLLNMKKCHFPEMNPFAPEIKHLLKHPEDIACAIAANSDFRGRTVFKTDRQNNLIRLFNPRIPCCYRPFYRANDNEVWIEPTPYNTYVCHNITQDITPIGHEHEFLEVICDDKRRSYRDGFAFVHRKPKVEERIKETERAEEIRTRWGKASERLSVIILGFDSTSQLNFVRRMPKSVEFLKSLGAIRLEGYNKVGENTLPNVAPLLTGLHLSELKDLCVDPAPPSESAVHIDSCPFIWKNFSDRGYRTSFTEDEVSTGVFNLYWSHAFLNPPTDHYFRPFSVRMYNAQNSYEGMCYGSRLSFEPLIDNLEKLATTYKNDLVFQFTWSSKLTHDDLNRLGWADESFVKTLTFLRDNGNLNNTALFLVGDHGSRKQEFRKTRQGQLEDRLPLAYVVLPPWFTSKYPLAMKNLQRNRESLTSAFDLHETFKDFMDLAALSDLNVHYKRQTELLVSEKKGIRKGTSLFTAFPANRGCISAGIPPHWCVCYKKYPISNKSPEVYDAIAFIIRTLNTQIMSYKHLCAHLQWKKITSVLKWHPEESIEDTFNGNAEENYKRTSLLQIAFETKPGNAQFEITVMYEPEIGWRLTEQVVRLDSYSSQSYCMPKQDLKKVCHCIHREPMEDKIDEQHDDFIGLP